MVIEDSLIQFGLVGAPLHRTNIHLGTVWRWSEGGTGAMSALIIQFIPMYSGNS